MRAFVLAPLILLTACGRDPAPANNVTDEAQLTNQSTGDDEQALANWQARNDRALKATH